MLDLVPNEPPAFVLEGGFELPIEGQPTRTLKAGDGVQIPPNTPHAGGKAGTAGQDCCPPARVAFRLEGPFNSGRTLAYRAKFRLQASPFLGGIPTGSQSSSPRLRGTRYLGLPRHPQFTNPELGCIQWHWGAPVGCCRF